MRTATITALALTAALGAPALPQSPGDGVPGRYEAVGEAGRCSVTLIEAGRRPPDSRLVVEEASGLAFSAPGCGLDLASAAIWRIDAADGAAATLSLFDPAGALLWAGEREGETWRGLEADGDAVALSRAD